MASFRGSKESRGRVFILVYRLVMDAKTLQGDGVAGWKYPSLLEDFLAGTASMARKRHLASSARGFYCFCLMARIGVQGVQMVQMVQGVQDVQMVQDVQGVQGVQRVQGVQMVQGVLLRPICILRARMKERHTCCSFTAQLDFYISIHFFWIILSLSYGQLTERKYLCSPKD